MKEKKQPKECKHETVYPVAFFDEQETLDIAILVVECEDCGMLLWAFGKTLKE